MKLHLHLYRETVRYIESKERLGEVCVFVPEYNTGRLIKMAQSYGHYGSLTAADFEVQ